jgi:hypothetical protein
MLAACTSAAAETVAGASVGIRTPADGTLRWASQPAGGPVLPPDAAPAAVAAAVARWRQARTVPSVAVSGVGRTEEEARQSASSISDSGVSAGASGRGAAAGAARADRAGDLTSPMRLALPTAR